MAHDGLLVGDLARKAGTTRKALRLYEAAGLLAPARRTSSGYRLYSSEALPLLAFILKARRIGFSVGEIKSIVGIRRSGKAPCRHVHELVRRRLRMSNECSSS
jgi:MerR family transcriptional regulator, copper efflux regulator